ncbi:hypothetical protein TIFTF001_022955 [Ficus carica]|uniref:Uncharacterized protein n=1 Tax=Ficus carica TaxID=3494 RepID=A0AA88AWE3_FICCA|nr:hypothetical protein TIFTF001_022955 [Ficus carica]
MVQAFTRTVGGHCDCERRAKPRRSLLSTSGADNGGRRGNDCAPATVAATGWRLPMEIRFKERECER